MSTSIRDYLESGSLTSRQLQAATGLSQPAVSRQIASMGDSIIKLRDGRSFRYAMTCISMGSDSIDFISIAINPLDSIFAGMAH
ncbi:MAG: ArsR family transcriptional regulator [Candidatus Sedimenticola sp. (ex Thyasira tokunagai)]